MPNNHHYNKNLRLLAQKLRNNPTKAEKHLWYQVLAKKQFRGLRFLRQRVIENYIVDFFCPELELIIEVDGKSHEFEDVLNKDIVRQQKLEELGFQVIRFSDWEVLERLSDVQILLLEKVEDIERK